MTLAVVAGAAAAGFVQGLSGFAFGMVAMAFWAWTVAPQFAGPMVVFGSLVGQLLSIGSIRRGFDWRRVLPFVLGGALGIPGGVLLLRWLDPTVFKLCIGVLLTVYCPTLLFAAKLPRIDRGGRLADGGIGLIGGIMGGLGGLTGPAPTLWCALRGWSRDAQRAVFQSFNLAMHALTLTAYAASGLITAEVGRMFLLIAPAACIPVLVGARLYMRFSDTMFRRLVLLLLALSGVAMLASSLTRLLRG